MRRVPTSLGKAVNSPPLPMIGGASMWASILLLALLLSALGPGVSQASVLAPVDTCGGAGDLGANFTAVTTFEMPQQVSGVCQPKTAGVAAIALYTGATWPNDQYFQMKVPNVIGSTTRVAGIALRGTTGARTQYECQVIGPLGGTATLTIYRFTAGAATSLATTGAAATVNANDTAYCEIQTYTIIFKINGSTILTFDDSLNGAKITSGKPGVVLFSGGVITDTQVDDLTGGDFTTASVSAPSLGWMEVDE